MLTGGWLTLSPPDPLAVRDTSWAACWMASAGGLGCMHWIFNNRNPADEASISKDG